MLVAFVLFALVVFLISFATCREPWDGAAESDGGWTVDQDTSDHR